MFKKLNRVLPLRKCYSAVVSGEQGGEKVCKWAQNAEDIRNIFCNGPILHAIQMGNVFPDCKTFVDMNIRTSIAAVNADWKLIEKEHGGNPIPMTALIKFLQDNFENVESHSQLEKWVPPDWNPNPSIIKRIEATEYQYFAKELNILWFQLARKMSAQVAAGSDKSTLIYVPHGFIIPGGRFRELYYWDTMFVILGLLACDMKETVRNMLENMVYLVKTYGFIFNGTRIYYQFRSQPPLLLMMVNEYVKKTKDMTFVKENYSVLAKEVEHWEKNRMITITKNGRQYNVFRYFCCTPGPRPESYREDVETASKKPDQKTYLYQAIASSAESGWDFSSRWFSCERGNTLANLTTQDIIPIDLNSYIHKNYELLYQWASELKMTTEMEMYDLRRKSLKDAISNVLWDETDGMWYDMNWKQGALIKQYSLSNLTPLWTGSYDEANKPKIAERVMDYFSRYNLWKFTGGLPTTMCFTGEQWDWPNSWPPLQLIASEGFKNIGLTQLALQVASNWVHNNYIGFIYHGVMFEKLDCRRPGVSGFGGEYGSQVGFGWSNGVVLHFLNEYSKQLRPFDNFEHKSPFKSTKPLSPEERRHLS